MTRILVVDDEIDTLNLLRTILEISGYSATTTLNSVDAITLAEIERPDCVLLDIMMPQLDGFTLCKLMRVHPATKHLPIVFVTAYSALDLEDRRKEAGADMVLPKPIGMETLIDAVEKALTMRKNGGIVEETSFAPPPIVPPRMVTDVERTPIERTPPPPTSN
jgi:CheY-like chemotaxis protein